MQRFVYSPRVYVFVKDQDGKIHDLSRYVTSGSVSRRIDAVSGAEINLRNPKMMFTAHRDENGNPVGAAFHPMDPITIYLRRVKNRPVRVFTGFLDSATYLQLFPGVMTMTASCTLKRLLHTYFDPGLPYTMSFLTNYGWSTTGDGQWFSNNALNEFKPDGTEVVSAHGGGVDGSISDLLYATLQHIGNWDTSTIYIEPLPGDLFTRLNELAQQFEASNEEGFKQYEELLKRIAGEGSFGTGTSNVDVSGVTGDVPKQVYEVGVAMGIDPNSKLMVSAFETGLVEAPVSGGNSFGNPSGGDLTGVPGASTTRQSAGWRQETVASYPGVDRNNVPESAKRYFTEGQAIMSGSTQGKAGTGTYQTSWTAGNLAQAIQGSAYPDRYDQVKAQALTLIRQMRDHVATQNGATPGQGLDPTRVVDARTGTSTTSTKSTRLDAIVAQANHLSDLAKGGLAYSNTGSPSDQNGYDCSSSVASLLRAAGYKDVPARATTATIKQYMKPGPDPTGRVTFWNSDVSNMGGNNVHIWASINGRPFTTADHLVGHWKDDYYAKDNPEANQFHAFHVGGLDEAASLPANANTNGVADPTADPSSSSLGGVGGAALFGELELASMGDIAEALLLSGEKSLMNDKPLMPFIQQMCNASLRHFQSLPDGKFYAFHADYFGEMFHHPPYWEIDDIEILDGKVELSDDKLLTHSFVIGDSLGPSYGNDKPEYIRALASSGVVTVFNAFLSNSILNRTASQTAAKNQAANDWNKSDKNTNWKEDPAGMNILMDTSEAAAFLDRYGARPQVEDMPMIKTPYFEMFLAYQHFLQGWARQFITPFTFTFMPELFPGGKVGFPDHGLQMYIEEVVHSWDYESGFTTTAKMSAPSVYGKDTTLLPPNMARAIIEPSAPAKKAAQAKPSWSGLKEGSPAWWDARGEAPGG